MNIQELVYTAFLLDSHSPTSLSSPAILDDRSQPVAQPLIYQERPPTVDMATKQAFAKSLREVRFHLCPTGSASDATRLVYATQRRTQAENRMQDFSEESISRNEAKQPRNTDPHQRMYWHSAKAMGKIWYGTFEQ